MVHTRLRKNRMAGQIAKLPQNIGRSNDALDCGDEWRAPSRKTPCFDSNFIRPMGPWIKDGIEPRLVSKGQPIFPETRAGNWKYLDAVVDDGISRLVAADCSPERPGV